MGLDMYLEKKTFVKNYSFEKAKDKTKVSVLQGGKKHPNIDTKKITYIIEEAGYWRKANAIHKFFVDNVGDGNDNCQEMNIDSEVLTDLLERCNKILKGCKLVKGKVVNGQTSSKDGWVDNIEDGEVMTNPKLAEELLPTTTDGCFFGSKDYDQWYYKDIENTKEICVEALKSIKNGADIYYQASW